MPSVRVFLTADDLPTAPDDLAQLNSAEVETEDTDSLISIAHRAEEESRLELPDARILFVTPPDEHGRRRVSHFFYAFVDDEDTLRWLDYPADFTEITVRDLVRTKEYGLFEGDPYALLWMRPGIGNGGIVVLWSDLLRFLGRC